MWKPPHQVDAGGEPEQRPVKRDAQQTMAVARGPRGSGGRASPEEAPERAGSIRAVTLHARRFYAPGPGRPVPTGIPRGRRIRSPPDGRRPSPAILGSAAEGYRDVADFYQTGVVATLHRLAGRRGSRPARTRSGALHGGRAGRRWSCRA
ncbi:MAG: hypothetical protein MZV63_16815 [Marinilabiliales bacterium]|nr:hypothetical protein [Marinilabiliales bacterium]